MGRGDAKRRRNNNAIRAAAEKKNLDPALLLAKGKKEKTKKKTNEDMPASLRKMLQLKAAAEGKPRPDFRSALLHGNGKPRGDKNPGTLGENPQSDANNTDKGAEGQLADDTKQRQKQKQSAKVAPGPVKPTLKARKKDFLKKKKLKRKGKYVDSDDEDEGSDPEERVQRAAAAIRPFFGDQAQAPIDVNLKRRHWKEGEKKSSDRCKTIYMKQLANARKRSGVSEQSSKKAVEAAAREEVIEAYRKQKRGTGSDAYATLQSLASLVRKDPVGTM